jgi:Tol biopolymer transport system component
VYEATDDRLGRPVAIKVILAGQQHEEGRKRFAREAQAASALNHPNIVTVHEAGRDGDVDFIVMERIAGETLRDKIAPGGLPSRTVLHWSAQIASALAAAHDAGIVHRDLKPTNIMVTDRGLVKVVDFGLAQQSLPRAGEASGPEERLVGTAQYMSPEQAQGRAVDSRSDVFSFGCVLYEMVTGRPAFKEDSAVATLAAILHAEPPPLAPGKAPRPLARLLFKCLQKNPAERWQHMSDVKQLLEDMARDLESSADGLPIAAVPSLKSGRGRLFGWPLLAAAGAGGALLAFAGLRLWPATGASRDHAELRMVTADDGLNGYAAVSRDGKLLAFASDRAKEGNLDIWLQQSGGRDPLRLTSDPADESDPAFSPDGTVIAFRSEKDGGGIYLVAALGGTPTLLASRGRHPRFSPDGRWIAYSVGGEAVSNPGSAGVFVVDSGGGVPRAVHPEMATATRPIWSPRGDRLLVLGRRDPNAPARAELDWWILPVEGGAPRRSGAFSRLDTQNLMRTSLRSSFPWPLDWREGDGDWILFNAPMGAAVNLWEIPLLGNSAAQRLTLGPGLHQDARWSADGRSLVFTAAQLNFDVWMQPLDPVTGTARGPLARLTEGVTEERAPSISWDGRRVAYVSRRSDTWSLRARDTASATEHAVLISPSQLTTARLSGDGSRIVYSSASDLRSVPWAGGAVEKLCEQCGDVMGASQDGRRALYEPMQDEDVLMFDSDRHATVTLARRPSPELILSSSRLSRDEKWVAFHALRNATNSAQIWIAPTGPEVPAPPSTWIPVTDGARLERDPAWSEDGRFLYFVSERDGFRCLWARPLDVLTKQPSGEAFAVRHFHSARFSLRHVGNQGFLTGLSAGRGALVFSMGELTGNVWLEQNGR